MHWVVYLDMAVGGMLAACAVYRARQYGHHFTGAMVLGGLSGFAGLIVRDLLLGMPAAGVLTLPVLCGVLGAGGLACLAHRFNKHGIPWFFLTDTLGFALAATTACAKALLCGAEPVAGILVGLAAGMSGGLLRDAALGDTARVLEGEYYVSAVLLGLVVEVGLIYAFWLFPLWWFVLAAAVIILLIRLGARHFRREPEE